MFRVSFLIASVLCTSAVATGQQEPATKQVASDVSRPFLDATATSVLRLPKPTIRLNASKGEKTVDVDLGLAIGKFSFDTKVQGVLDEGEPDTNLVTLDGLANGTSVDVGLSYLFWKPNADVSRQNMICVEFLRSQAATLEQAKQIGASGTSGGCTLSALPTLSFRSQFQQASTTNQRKAICRMYALSILVDPDTFECVAVNLPVTSLLERYDRLIDWSLPVQIGTRYKIGRSKFKWADTSTGDISSKVEVPWELGFAANVMMPFGLAATGEVRYQRDFSEQPTRTVCSPLASLAVGVTTCRDVGFGIYDTVTRKLVTGALRKWIGPFAADLRYSYDWNNSTHTVEIPVYFLSTEGKGLSGGIAAGWTSDVTQGEKGWSVRAFVADVIGLWPQLR